MNLKGIKITKVLAGTVVIALIVVAVKLMFFRSVSDNYFARDYRSFSQVPGGLVVLRPTHYPFLKHEGIFTMNLSEHEWRMMGRNVPLIDVMAAAYGGNPSRVVLPSGAPKGNFDFLITVSTNQRAHLQAAIRQKLGYVAQKETRDTDVLVLKVVDEHPPNLAVSGSEERQNANFNDIKITLQHLPLLLIAEDGHPMRMTDGLELFLATPVVDKSEMTKLYDYSMIWDMPTRKQLRDPATARPAVDKILGGWGLGLKPDTASLEMLVVKQAD